MKNKLLLGIVFLLVAIGVLGDSNTYTWTRATTDSKGSVPVGGIIIWSGAVSNIPSCWAIADGTSGTVNLQDKFVIGAGGNYSVGEEGGS